MKAIKIIVSTLIFIIVLLFVIPLLLPSVYHVERSIVIHRSVDSVFYFLVDLTQRSKWDPWLEKEPTAISEISGSMQGIGAVWSWEGELIGKGTLEIKDAQENVSITNRLVFEAPQQAEADAIWKLKSDNGKTEVTWILKGELEYPIGRLMGLFMNHFMGKDFEQGLANLKNELESEQ
ncbi:SRPBCC family protein [bacterium]